MPRRRNGLVDGIAVDLSAKNGKFIPNKDVEVSDEYIKNVKKIVSNKITFSKQVLDYDYYRHIFKQ